MKIGRTLFWFKKDNDNLLTLNDKFFDLAVLLNLLLNENYSGRPIKFINIYFANETTYEMFPSMPKDDVYYYNGHLTYYGVIDLDKFEALSFAEQRTAIWEAACSYLTKSAVKMKNDKLLATVEEAQQKGRERDLVADHILIESNIILQGRDIHASIWVIFEEQDLINRLILERDQKVFLEKDLYRTKERGTIFLEMYKKIEAKNENTLIIKGMSRIPHLPMKISI